VVVQQDHHHPSDTKPPRANRSVLDSIEISGYPRHESLVSGSLAIVVETTKRVPIQSISLEAALIPGAVFALVYSSLRPMTHYRLLNDSDRTNIYSTSFIAWKIWRTARDCTPVGGMGLRVSCPAFHILAHHIHANYTDIYCHCGGERSYLHVRFSFSSPSHPGT
jgi:hypothetical protein